MSLKQKGKSYVIGVGMTKFEKPGRRENFDYPDMAKESVTSALQDAKIEYNDIQQAYVGYVYGDSTCGQRALYQFGQTGIPIINVNNNCATGSSALFMAHNLVTAGAVDCVLALGFEKMQRGSLSSQFDDRTNPLDKHVEMMMNTVGIEASPVSAQMFGNAGREHMKKYGTKVEHFAKIAEKNHRHSANNPRSQFQEVYTLEQILASPTIHEPLTKLQCCPTSDGSAAVIVASERFVRERGLESQAVEIVGMELATDFPSTFSEKSSIKLVGYDLTAMAAKRLFQRTGLKPSDMNVIELHDCFSANELITYEALGLCPPGKAGELIDRGDNTYGGKYVVNPSGGLISKGHPLGATGLAQCTELCLQLRGMAEKRQVPNVRYCLQHNVGLGGAVVVAIYKLGFPGEASKRPDSVGSIFKSAAIFEKIANAFTRDGRSLVAKVQGTFAFKIKATSGEEGIWLVDAKTGNGSVEYGSKKSADVTLVMNDGDLVELMEGRLNPQKAFMQGKLKILGNMGLAMKLQEFQKQVAEALKSNL